MSQHLKSTGLTCGLTRGLAALLLLSAGLLPASQAATPKAKVAAAAAATDEVELRFFPLPQQRHQIRSVMTMKMDMRMEPREGMSEDERAKMEQAMQAAKMPMTMRSEFDQRMTTTAADKEGNFQLQLRGKSLPMEMSNAAGERVGPAKSTIDIKIDAKLNQKTSRFQSMQLAGTDSASNGLSEGLLKQLLTSMTGLEGRRLKVGESAEMPLDMALPVPNGRGMGVNMVGRYTLVKLENGVADFDVGVRISMDMDGSKPDTASSAEPASSSPAAASAADTASSAPAAADAKNQPMPSMKASGQGKGRMSLRLADRLMLTQQMEMTVNMRIEAAGKPAMNMSMDMQMEASGKNLKR
ncbi:hypothetical protein [Paucibacter sp. DJ2R-2]|uniref:hypothetical protein n=1 Tax=Paucibacter sp. DJ2R-2 TaxID=2893558 RepID=UPI0021E3CB0B|nr:hypothetical protein [Paucibacter sp. DJ2R-2]MCV2423068.1 hypothetical protein [Paucibacter sp. DJ4R-1]MCV2440964.1 hypothetical protein [Paucibacter sp. DJ2R-2]